MDQAGQESGRFQFDLQGFGRKRKLPRVIDPRVFDPQVNDLEAAREAPFKAPGRQGQAFGGGQADEEAEYGPGAGFRAQPQVKAGHRGRGQAQDNDYCFK
jgi:hypothetical protein